MLSKFFRPDTQWAIYLLGFFVLIVSVFYESISPVVSLWSGYQSASTHHGWLVFACSVYLIFIQKDEIGAIVPKPNLLALIALVGCSFIWFIGKIADVMLIQLAAIPALMLFAVTANRGISAGRALILPIGLLYLAFPIWFPFLPYLVDVTTAVTHYNLKLIGRPVFVEDNYIHLPGGSFVVEESCAGLQFLLVSTTLSLMSSSMYKLNLKTTIGLVGISMILSFLANWIRVIVIVLIGDATNMEHSIVEDHANLGWVIYLVLVLIPFFWISKYFVAPPEQNSDPAAAQNTKPSISKRSIVVLGLSSIVAIAFGPLLVTLMNQQLSSAEIRRASLPQSTTVWQQTSSAEFEEQSREWYPQYNGASQKLKGEYESAEGKANFYVVHYDQQQQGKEIINARNSLVDGTLWAEKPGSQEKHALVTDDGTRYQFNLLEIESQRRETVLVGYWYNIAGSDTISEYQAKLFQLLGLLSNRADASLNIISISCATNCNNAQSLFDKFFLEIEPELRRSSL